MNMQPAGGIETASTRNTLLAEGDHLPELVAGMFRGVADSARHGRDGKDGLGEPMRAICDTARLCGLHAEQLLVILKDAWRRLPEAKLIDRHESEELLTRVIHDCIEAYYAEQPPLSAPSE